MPSLITHDFFGRDVYDRLFGTIGGSRDEAEAFLLGNQGPDPLFYAVVCARIAAWAARCTARSPPSSSRRSKTRCPS